MPPGIDDVVLAARQVRPRPPAEHVLGIAGGEGVDIDDAERRAADEVPIGGRGLAERVLGRQLELV